MIERRVDAWGRTIVSPDSVIEMLMQGSDVSAVLVEDEDAIKEYNEWCRFYDKSSYLISTPEAMDHSPEEEHDSRSNTWFISENIQQINVRQFLLEELCKDDICRDRVNHEMDLFEERNLVPLLQLMMYLVYNFRKNKVVWGVGRGSSVSSYVLFLIGVHKIDPIKYGLDVHDFLK